MWAFFMTLSSASHSHHPSTPMNMAEIYSPSVLFDALAQDYESMRESILWSPFPHFEKAFPQTRLENKKFLDIGCGTGELSRHIQAKGGDCIGVDISQEMCMLAAERSENLAFFPLDITEGLPMPDAQFDGVVALGVLEYAHNIQYVFSEIRRVLKPGGTFLGVVERRGKDCPSGLKKQVRLFDHWLRYRMLETEAQALAAAHFSHAKLDRVLGYVLEETDERIQYIRIIAKK